jgi:hypothetical protein
LLAGLAQLEQALESRLAEAFPEVAPSAHGDRPAAAAVVVELAARSRPGADRFESLVQQHQLDRDGVLLLLLSLAPWVNPSFIDDIVRRMLPDAGDYPLLGGMRGRQYRGFLPTGDTALFLLAGRDLGLRMRWHEQLRGSHPLLRAGVLQLGDAPAGEPPMSGRLSVDAETAERLLTGTVHPPRLSVQFPALLLKTRMRMDELVLPARTSAQISELLHWAKHRQVLMHDWELARKLRPGCRALFHGPPGTGKTLTASLLGQALSCDVYRVDLSTVVSKYIGETEKNLASLFDTAEHKDWVLFFDEADALFGKRTQVKDSHDRYANQEISFLLQRLETFDGLIILASNLAANVDEAFARRFEHVIHFPLPGPAERRRLWEMGLPRQVSLEPGVSTQQLAAQHELSGAMIMNVIRHGCLHSLARGDRMLTQSDLLEGIRREFAKENRVAPSGDGARTNRMPHARESPRSS